MCEQEKGATAVAESLAWSPLRFFEEDVALAKENLERVKDRFDASTESTLRELTRVK